VSEKLERKIVKMNKLKTMLKTEKRHSKERYYVTKVDEFSHVVNSGLFLSSKETKRNIAYSLKYLEFLKIQLDELVLDDVMKKMIWKNFIITSISVIEVIMKDRTNNNKHGKELLNEFREKNPLNLSDNDLNKLDDFRKLRNKVHLEIKYVDDNTDWFKFEEKEYLEMKNLLYNFLTSEKMFNSMYIKNIDFLKS